MAAASGIGTGVGQPEMCLSFSLADVLGDGPDLPLQLRQDPVLEHAGPARRTPDLLAEHLELALEDGELVAGTDWLASQPDTSGLGVGYFRASTGAGAARVAAVQLPSPVGSPTDCMA
jgi:hypothetical protein